MSTEPSQAVINISERAKNDACVDLWFSLRTYIDVTDDPSNAELDIFKLLSEHPAAKAVNKRTAK